MEQPAPEGLSLWDGPTLEQGKGVLRKEQQRQGYVLSTAPFPIPLLLWWEKGGKKH